MKISSCGKVPTVRELLYFMFQNMYLGKQNASFLIHSPHPCHLCKSPPSTNELL